MIKELIHRRIPHIIGSYLFAGSSLILFIDWLIARYEFPEHYVTLSLFGIASIIPSVVILAYFHGAPGKDEWTKIEKIGIPINVIFIALVMVLGNNYNWWTKGNDKNIVEKPKGLILGEIKSNEDNIEFIKRKLYGSSADKTTLDVLSEIEKSNIYDELTSFIEINNIRDDIDYITKYDLIERFNKKGEEVPKYSFKYFREFSAIDPNSENKMKQQMKILGKIHTNKTSTYNFLINSSADLGYFPLLYKINTSADKIEYCLFHCLVYNEIKFTEQDTSRNFKFLLSWDILERSDLVEAMADFIENRIYKFLAVNRGVVEVVNENKLLFKFNKDLKNKLNSRMILDVKREYNFNSKTDIFENFVELVLNDHLEYEKNVNLKPESINYKNYHTVANGKIPYTKEELNSLLSKSHEFFEFENKKGGYQFGKGFGIYIKVQVSEVYDSTASATVYESGDPNIKLKRGDIVLF